jgi:hypothetical protein
MAAEGCRNPEFHDLRKILPNHDSKNQVTLILFLANNITSNTQSAHKVQQQTLKTAFNFT